MDSRSFDALTRSLATPKSRRGFLGTLAAIGAGLSARGAADAQAQCPNTSCKNNPGKCGAGCVCCVYGNGNTRCLAPGSCSGTPTCPAGTVPGPSGCAAPTTTTTAAPTTTTTTTTAPAATTTTTNTTTTTAPTTTAPTTTTTAPTTTAGPTPTTTTTAGRVFGFCSDGTHPDCVCITPRGPCSGPLVCGGGGEFGICHGRALICFCSDIALPTTTAAPRGLPEGSFCTAASQCESGLGCCNDSCASLLSLDNCLACGATCNPATDTCFVPGSGGDPQSGCCAIIGSVCDPAAAVDRCCLQSTCTGTNGAGQPVCAA